MDALDIYRAMMQMTCLKMNRVYFLSACKILAVLAQYFHIYFPATQGRPQSRSDGNYYYQMMRRRRDVWLTPKLSDTFCSLHWSPWPSSNDNNILHVNYPWQTCTRPYRTWTMKFYKTQNIELKHNYLSRVYTIRGDKDAHYYSV